ncbi:GNAT family N-acetyltransferase [Streptomyces mirabilis]|jgi:ribosomal protein S18 acetylase RimI-like enzyme|uniref:Ribosomal protein S18 acetylase RimI n=1 Tax=Streptomyces mirabilis TaxID=68239 RepID=A0A1I2E1D7_9ACTN|nr:N-acetyltransferase [Streptomyces mirabilis]SFE86675.1 Ribosomal protein S18 acetylase RimI [Streptomyces mirabilis]
MSAHPLVPFSPPSDIGPFHIRPASEDDLPALVRLDTELFPDFAYPYFALRQFLDMYTDHLLVLDDGSSLHGYALSAPSADGRRSWILGLGVAKQLRGQGLARRLMQETLRRLPTDGVHEVWLTVEPTNTAAIALYRSLGFVEQGAREGYFGPGNDRLLLALRH